MDQGLTTLIFDYDGVFVLDEYRGIKEVCPNEQAIETIETTYYSQSDCHEFWNDLRYHFSSSLSNDKLRFLYNREDDSQIQHKKRMFRLVREFSNRFSLVLLSNQIRDRADYLRLHEDLSLFDRIFFSNEIGLKKPDIPVFEFVLSQIQQSPEHCLFIDDATENIEAASTVGLRTHHYRSFEKFAELF